MPTYGDSILGNFLSGMETGIRGDDRVPLRALETSLVEWKLSRVSFDASMRNTLETSLVEWKHNHAEYLPERRRPWKLP